MKTLEPKEVDWRKNASETDFDADDEELYPTPPDITASLGFDPLEFSKENAIKSTAKDFFSDLTYCRNSDTSLFVTAKETEPEIDKGELEKHDKARDAAEEIYRQAALAAAAKIQEEKNKKKREAAILLLLLLAGEEAYHKTYSILGTKELLNRDETQIEEQAKTFALARQPLLKNYAEKLSDKTAKAETSAADEKLSATETTRAIRAVAKKVSTIMTATESQITYGTVQSDRLKRSGIKFKRWQTCEDERVRPTHEACQLEGAIPMDRKFGNGLAFPGDPAGDIQELAGCRCWLLPVNK